jgi:RNA polymerase sigma-70 factor (ECF subfamily)
LAECAPQNEEDLLSREQNLVSRAVNGDAQAFDCLFVQHKDAVYACLWHLLDGNADLVEEAVGNVFLSAYRGLRRFRGDSSFSTWLYRIAVNEAHARRRQERRWRPWGSFSLQEQVAETLPNVGDPAEDLLQADEKRRLWQAVRALPEPFRTPTILHYMSGMTSQEISDVLRRPAGTIRYQLSRALQILRERLGSEWQN